MIEASKDYVAVTEQNGETLYWTNEDGFGTRYEIYRGHAIITQSMQPPMGGAWHETKVSAPMVCPTCGAQEIKNPEAAVTDWRWNIKPFRVDHWSKCLVCDKAGRDPWFE